MVVSTSSNCTMSSKYCSFTLLIVLVSLSLHACNARRDLEAFHSNKKRHASREEHYFLDKASGDKEGGVADEISIPRKKLGDGFENLGVETRTGGKLTRHDIIKGKGKLGNGVEPGRSSVSWRVPHKKRGEKQPGFNLDYSPPKTHPPSHN